MATRSQIIQKAQGLIVQGSDDSTFWTYTFWNDKYHIACEMLHKEIVDSELNFFIVRDYSISKNANNRFTLPSDFYSLLWVKESSDSDPIYEVDDEEKETVQYSGYRIYNGELELVNFDSIPDTIVIDYHKTITEMGDWSGSTDVESSGVSYTQDKPLDSASAARTLAELIALLAQIKDESATQSQSDLTRSIIDRFVNRLGTRNKQSPRILGY